MIGFKLHSDSQTLYDEHDFFRFSFFSFLKIFENELFSYFSYGLLMIFVVDLDVNKCERCS